MSDHQHSAASGGEHTQAADAVEAEIDDLAQESERLKTQIGDTRADWESRKADDKVPGAMKETQAAQDDQPPEAERSAASDGEDAQPEE